MSPALQGNLEVDRYIGSYLISQRGPPSVKSSKRYPKQKNTEAEKVARNYNKYCFPPREHHVGGPPRYPGIPPLPVEYNHPGGSGWAGVPLISMTSGNHRRNKKLPPPSTNQNQVQKYPNKQVQHNAYGKGKDSEDNVQHDNDRSPLTRLAIHTQGAPLIQAGRFGNNNRCRNNNYSREQSTRVYRGEGVRWETTRDVKGTAIKENKDQPCGITDSCSVVSDESSGNSENSLPRIIKPRKRRKKDRKPITGNNPVVPSTPPNDSVQYPHQAEHNTDSPGLKSYLHELSKSNLLSDNIHISTNEDKQNEDLIDPLASDEFPLGNLLDDEEDKDSEPTTVCQCRYCDPSGVIWDVDQRCYSPFLTPPSPTDTKLPFGNPYDSFRAYGRQMAVLESSSPPPPSQFLFGGDLASLLKRSWSDPSPCNSQSPDDSRPPSAGLQVSSEIVTSPNGHRDIEIKFYSSPVKMGVSDRDLGDRCFLAEE